MLVIKQQILTGVSHGFLNSFPAGTFAPLRPARRKARAARRIAECKSFTSKLQVQSERHAAKKKKCNVVQTIIDHPPKHHF